MEPVSTSLNVGGNTLAQGGALTALGASVPVWGWAALAGANILGSILGSNAQARQRKQQALMRAAEIETSPWTNRGPSTEVSTAEPNAWANLIGAGTNVLAQGQALGKSMRESAAEERKQAWNKMLADKAKDLKGGFTVDQLIALNKSSEE